MVLLVVSFTLLCAVAAAPSRPIVVSDLPHAAPVPVVSAPVAVVSSQSHAQDELGQYSYSYSNPLSSKVETKTVDGVTRGGYSYLDSHGLVQSVNYVSDDVNGFRVAASNLPLGRVTPQEDEPLVAHEKAKAVAALHDAAVKDAAEAAVAHENDVAPAPVYVDASAPVVSVATAVLPEAPAVAHSPAYASTPAPPVYVTAAHPTPAPLQVTPSPVPIVHHSPTVTPVVYVTPAPYRSPTPAPIVESHSYPSTALPAHEAAHSYAIVELDSSDIPAPVPTPGAYFHPAAAAAVHDLVATSPTAVPVYEEHAPVKVVAPVPSPAPVAYVAPAVHAAPVVAAPAPVVAAPVAVVTSQSHAQDELGQYSYSYSNPLSAKVETKTVDGITRGGYSYLDSHGLVQNVNYVSDDHNGFRVAASNLPAAAVPVDIPDSTDVAAAKAVFFAEIAKAKAAVNQAH